MGKCLITCVLGHEGYEITSYTVKLCKIIYHDLPVSAQFANTFQMGVAVVLLPACPAFMLVLPCMIPHFFPPCL